MSQHGQGYEEEDIHLAPIAKWVAVLVVIVVSVVFGTRYLFDYDAKDFQHVDSVAHPDPAKDFAVDKKFPQPVLQVQPRVDWETFYKQETAIVTSYGWSDERSGLVRVPLDVAMEMLLKKGLPVSQEGAK